MEILKKLIQIDSVTGKEGEIQKIILNLLVSYGLRPLKIKGNLAVPIKGKNFENCLIFNAHVDTVNPGDIKLWDTDPFSALEKNGKTFGLGASDNKSSVAALLSLAKKFSKEKPNCDIFLTFTVGEENDGHGTGDTIKFLETKYIKKYKSVMAVVCEPTGLNYIGLAHKGNMFLKITTSGKSGHGSKPIKVSEHSVLKMFKVTKSLEKLGKNWKKKYKNQILGNPTIGLATSIVAGNENTPNKFSDFCSATFDIRTTPEMHEQTFKEIKKAVGKLGKVEYLYPAVSPGFTSKDSKIARVFKKVTKLKFTAFPGSTDMPFFTQKGIPTVIFGPGEMSQMHKANEYCYSGKIDKCVEIFLKIVKGYNNFND
jgi:acetylornithine deacetylase/succinyl-diaminopimelate desuccinylase family protein